jgi:hypothetical protein
MSSTNAPERFLSWRFEDPSSEASKRRLQYLPDSKKPNAGTFILAKEDHTLGMVGEGMDGKKEGRNESRSEGMG